MRSRKQALKSEGQLESKSEERERAEKFQTEREQHCLQANQPLYFRCENQTRLFNTMRFLLDYVTWLPYVSVDKSKDEGKPEGLKQLLQFWHRSVQLLFSSAQLLDPQPDTRGKPTLLKKPVGL